MDIPLLNFVIDMLSQPAAINFIENVLYDDYEEYVTRLFIVRYIISKGLPQEEKQALIKSMRLLAHKVANFMSEIVGQKADSIMSDDLEKDWGEITKLIRAFTVSTNFDKVPYEEMMLDDFSCDDIERIENMLLETVDCSNSETLNKKQSRVLLLKKAIPDAKHTPPEEQSQILLGKIALELENLPFLICKTCEAQPLALLLIGGLLSLKPMAYDTWNRVQDDLDKIKKYYNCVTSSNMWHIINYCYDDLPNSLKLCFLYFACYPIGYEIPATSLAHIWSAEGFVTPGEEEWVDEGFAKKAEKVLFTPGKKKTRESIANDYLEQLVQRSLVCVSKRSLLGTIKSFRLPRPIHKFAIQQSITDEFMAANPDQEKIESLFRLAIYSDNKKQYTESVGIEEIHNPNPSNSFIKQEFPTISNKNFILELPENIGDMKDLQTLDVRGTSIETLPKSLWTISKLCHVYVNPSRQIKGPPSTAIIPNMHILKTVAAHESWQENIPNCLINLRKFSFSNWDNLDWKFISKLLSRTDHLITVAIIGNNIPSEFADIRAFPNLETVKSIKLEGQWKYCRKLFIDNYKFPPNLTKLTLTNSGLKEDPMPTLERLLALKLLRLQDGAYTGNQMVCSANGFPQLQFLKLKKLENLVNWVCSANGFPQLQFLKLEKLENLANWEVEPSVMSHLTTLHVVQCGKFKYPSNLTPRNLTVTISNIDD